MTCECHDNVPQYTLEEVSDHCHPDSCWIVYVDKVYDITKFIDEHPGGFEILLEHAGTDATSVFKGTGHTKEARDMLSLYFIGNLVEEERIYKNKFQKGKKCRSCLRKKKDDEKKQSISETVNTIVNSKTINS
ncbi:cytochrome b5 [Exaiptasia diaphana]|uniref:Cytochrome b5 n=1 Tax=Exaiptasia diaphana TaxID=2652724 RepID=A0A913XE99_EXADI|nr:cytochrome b5 [Exaiptasia diaphana]KXJ12793.1 Cytochrome b5 [Exaiptasia diaphana]